MPAQALRNTLDLAQHAERWGYRRYWLAEHHNMPGIASAATAVVIGYVAGGTSTIRVGSGGIMLPNHAPLVIAEQFGTLESLYPGRIDLGLGRAPGTDHDARPGRCAATSPSSGRHFSAGRAASCRPISGPPRPARRPRGSGRRAERADLAAGLEPVQRPAGGRARPALRVRLAFRARLCCTARSRSTAASFGRREQLDRPYAMVGVNVFAADTDAEARRLFTSLQQQFLNLRRGAPGQLPPPVDDDGGVLVADGEGAGVERSLALLGRRLARHRARRLERLHRGDAAPTRSWRRPRSSTTPRGCARSRSLADIHRDTAAKARPDAGAA